MKGRLMLLLAIAFATLLLPSFGKEITVDPVRGVDEKACLNDTDKPCKSLAFAVYQREVEKNDSIFESFQGEDMSDVVFVLRPGTYQAAVPILILNATNVTIRAEDPRNETIIRCVSYPNNGTGERFGPNGTYVFDDMRIDSSAVVVLEGLIFERCGPVTSAVFVNASRDITVRNCTFRETQGSAFQCRFTYDVKILSTVFFNNTNERDRSVNFTNETVDIEVLYRRILVGGALTFFSFGTTKTHLTVDGCLFVNNVANRNENNTRPVLLRENGHGGAVLVRLANVSNSSVVFRNSRFLHNVAQVDGAGVYLSLSSGAAYNTIEFSDLLFDNNTVQEAGGGGISLNSFEVSIANRITVTNSNFTSNNASAGGGLSLVLYQGDSKGMPDNLAFRNCIFQDNKAENDGTAVGLFSLLHVDEIGFPVSFEDCTFEDNESLDRNRDTSALAAFRFPITLNGSNYFVNNTGGGVTLLNTQMDAYGTIVMDDNTAAFGGGLAMDDRCLLNLHPGVEINFTNNDVDESGAGIYVDFPPIRFVIEFFNRLCFIQYVDDSGTDVSPPLWKANMNFINNRARLSGAAIYASDLHGCSWLGNATNATEFEFIFNDTYEDSPFLYQNNTVSGTEVVRKELATSPLSINATAEGRITEVQPGESVTIVLEAKDQLGNPREAVWSVSRPQQDTILGALPAGKDNYLYIVPSLNFSEDTNITLTFSLLRTLAESSTVELTVVVACHPGYTIGSDNTCVVRNEDNIVRRSTENRYIYIREGFYGWRNKDNQLITNIALPTYLNCSRDGRLSGCLFRFDKPDRQCKYMREGILCGQCVQGTGVSLDLQECGDNCLPGQILFSVLCVVVVVVSFFIMFFNVQVTNELKGFVFYAQVIGLVFRQFDSIRPDIDTEGNKGGLDFTRFVVNILGFSLPIPFCISQDIDTHWVVLLSFVPPFLVLITIILYARFARCLKILSNRTSLGGISLLLLFVYKYVADTSFILVSCVGTGDGYRFFYNGNTLCSRADFLPFHIMSLLLLIPVGVLPFLVALIPYKFSAKFKQFSDVITNGLRSKYRWWGGWDLGRRLIFVVVSFLGLITRPSLVLFLLAMTALLVLTLHCFTKPYKERYINIIEALILLDLLLVTGLLIDPESQVPIEFDFFMILLPFVYFVLYVCWRSLQFLYFKVTKKEAPRLRDLLTKVWEEMQTVGRKVDKMKDAADASEKYHEYRDSTVVANSDAGVGAPEEGGAPQGEGGAQQADQYADSENEQFNQLRVPDFDD